MKYKKSREKQKKYEIFLKYNPQFKRKVMFTVYIRFFCKNLIYFISFIQLILLIVLGLPLVALLYLISWLLFCMGIKIDIERDVIDLEDLLYDYLPYNKYQSRIVKIVAKINLLENRNDTYEENDKNKRSSYE